jgi:hypothetical protein
MSHATGPSSGPSADELGPLLPAPAAAAAPLATAVVPWWRRSLERLLQFLQEVIQPASRAERARRRALRATAPLALPGPRVLIGGAGADEAPLSPPAPIATCETELPFDLLLTSGHGAVPLFSAGPIDELGFFQRCGVPEHLEVEFLTRLAPEDRGREDYKPYGMFRLRSGDGAPLPRQEELPEAFWAALYREHGLVKILPAARVLSPRTSAWDARRNDPAAGRNRATPLNPDYNFKRVRGRRYTHADLLAILCRHLRGPERIAWIEGAFPEALEAGQIVHRYYLDASRRLWLVRHHWARGKSLHRAHTSEEAKQLLIASGALPRRKAA